MDRRTFLKAVAISGTVRLIPEFQPIATNELLVGFVREIWKYDLRRDEHLCRFDIRCCDTQLGLDMLYPNYSEEIALEARNVAIDVLTEKLNQKGLDPSQLVELDEDGQFKYPLGWDTGFYSTGTASI